VKILKVMILNLISQKRGSIMENKWGTGDERGTKLEFTVRKLGDIF